MAAYIPIEVISDEEEIFFGWTFKNDEANVSDRHLSRLASIPIVYTTKLDDMVTMKQNLTDLNAKQITNKLLIESKPKYTTNLATRKTNNSIQIQSYQKLDNVIRSMNYKVRKNTDNTHMRSLLHQCKPLHVVLQDCKKVPSKTDNTGLIPITDTNSEYDSLTHNRLNQNNYLSVLKIVNISLISEDTDNSLSDEDCSGSESTSSFLNTPIEDIDIPAADENYLEFTLLWVRYVGPNQEIENVSELYEIGKNGYLIRKLRFNERENKSCYIREEYKSLDINILEALYCCWYSLDKMITNLLLIAKISPSVVKSLQRKHTCITNNCRCCCIPESVKLQQPILILPQALNQTNIQCVTESENAVETVQQINLKSVTVPEQNIRTSTVLPFSYDRKKDKLQRCRHRPSILRARQSTSAF